MVLCRFCGGSPLTVPTFNNVADFRRIAERSEFSDGAMQVFGGSPLTVPTFDNVADFRRIAERSGMDDFARLI